MVFKLHYYSNPTLPYYALSKHYQSSQEQEWKLNYEKGQNSMVRRREGPFGIYNENSHRFESARDRISFILQSVQLNHCNVDERKEIEKLIVEFPHIFHIKGDAHSTQ